MIMHDKHNDFQKIQLSRTFTDKNSQTIYIKRNNIRTTWLSCILPQNNPLKKTNSESLIADYRKKHIG